MKRYLFITAGAIVILGLAVVVYFYFFNGAPSIVVAPTGTSSLPVAGQGAPAVTQTTPLVTPVTVSARLVQISKGPVVLGEAVVDVGLSGANASTTTGGTGSLSDIAVNYIERESGNVFSYRVRAATLTRISNKTIPGIQSAVWLPDGSFAFVRYLSGADFSTINTYALPASSSNGFFLPQNLTDIAVSSTSVLTLASGVNGSVASLEHTDGTHTATVFATPLSSLHVSFAGKGHYLAYTKPSGTLSGDAFLYDNTGVFSRVAGPLYGLTALASPSGKWALVSYVLNGTMQMELVNIATNETLPLPVATLTDKCVWAADDSSLYCGIPVDPPFNATYPDDWYQGAISFSDRIWKINVAGRYAELVLDFSKETKVSLDAEALATDAVGTTLVFVNKNDGSLWSYSL